MKMKKILFAIFCFAATMGLQAQISQHPDKFLGNITTWGQPDAGNGVESFYKMWNQLTPENETKWGSVEGSRGIYNWEGADRAYNYAHRHNFPFKFHTLVWGSQFPN